MVARNPFALRYRRACWLALGFDTSARTVLGGRRIAC